MVSPKNFWGMEITVPDSCNCLVESEIYRLTEKSINLSELYDIIAFELVGTPLI